MKYQRNQSLKKHTSFRIGGPADYFCVPKSIHELREAIDFARERKMRISVLGGGTNVLVLDRGFRGLVIKLAGGLSSIKVNSRKTRAGAGMLLPRLIRKVASRGLSGLEFLAGVPGSVGGAIIMNAGAWGREIGRYVEEIKVLDNKGRLKVVKNGKLGFGYRKSKLQKKSWIVVEATFKLRKQRKKTINKKIKECLAKRKETQPLGSPSCGSVFKNPKGDYAGRLIEEAGCKGRRVGDAQVSAKHGNFIVNLGDAKAQDVIKLMASVQKAVKDKFKILLEPEIKFMIKSAT